MIGRQRIWNRSRSPVPRSIHIPSRKQVAILCGSGYLRSKYRFVTLSDSHSPMILGFAWGRQTHSPDRSNTCSVPSQPVIPLGHSLIVRGNGPIVVTANERCLDACSRKLSSSIRRRAAGVDLTTTSGRHRLESD